jgi:hypothetical protein
MKVNTKIIINNSKNLIMKNNNFDDIILLLNFNLKNVYIISFKILSPHQIK